MKKVFSKAAKQASKELAREMSSQLKRNAVNDGWKPEVAVGLGVSYANGEFQTEHAPEHGTMMFDLEYGTENTLAKGTIRKMHASRDELADRFATLFERAVFKK